MRRQRERERLASEAYIRKLQEEEEQKTMLQLAQDQLLAKTLAKQDIFEKSNNRYDRYGNSTTVSNANKLNNQVKPTSQRTVKAKEALNLKKQNIAPTNKSKSERYTVNATNLTTVQKEPTETIGLQKAVPIHNAVTRVITQQSKLSQPNNSSCLIAPDEFIGSSSKIYGQQSEEELHVPSDVLSNKKKKLGVEVCVTTVNVEDEERIGSAESAGSHDSMNQEFHHFKPIKALPRTPFRTLDGKQIDPKLIRVLPILKRISNIVPKAPSPTHTKKVFGCTWSAFKRIARQHLLLKDSLNQLQQTDIKKTDCKPDQQSSRSVSSKTSISVLDESSNIDSRNVAFDNNKNYTKNMAGSRVVNGTELAKNDQTTNSVKNTSKRKPRNGQLSNSHKKKPSKPEKEIEVVQIDDDDDDVNVNETDCTNQARKPTPDPLAPSPDKVNASPLRPSSPVFEFAAVENIAERIKRRKTSRAAIGNAENVQVKSVERPTKAKSKKPSTKGRKQKTKKSEETALSKATKTKKKKVVVTTSVTSHIKKLAAKSAKRPRYTEDSESEEEPEEDEAPIVETSSATTQQPVPPPQPLEKTSEDSAPKREGVPSPSPRKRPRKNARPMPRKQRQPISPVAEVLDNSLNNEEETLIKEQERLERLAEQERRDRELALQLQARFDAMERVAGGTRRGVARLPATSPPLVDVMVEQPQRPPQKRPAVK